MKLRATTLLFSAAIIACLPAVVLPVSRWVVLRGFMDVEQQMVRRNVRRAADALQHKISDLALDAADYASWDGTYDFVADQDRGMRANPHATANPRLAYLLLYDLDGCRIDHIAVGRRGELPSSSEDLERFISRRPELLKHVSPTDRHSGLIMLPEGPVLAACAPILTSEGKGPIRGTLVVARHLDPELIEHLSSVTHLCVGFHPLDRPHPHVAVTADMIARTEQKPLVQAIDDDVVGGYAVLNDITGKPALLVEALLTRDIVKQGKRSVFYFLCALGGGIAICAAGVWYLIDRTILRRLARMHEAVAQISLIGGAGSRIPEQGTDELGDFARAINQMLQAIEDADHARHAADERLRQIVASVDDAVWSLSPDGNEVLFVSPVAARIFGLPPDVLTVNGGPWQTAAIPGDAGPVVAGFHLLLEGEPLDVEYRIRRPCDGEIRWIRLRARSIYGENGECLRHDGICTDTTDSRRLSEKLQQANRDLVSVAHRAGMAEIATDVLHNVGNSLNGINVSASSMQDHLQRSVTPELTRVLNLLVERGTELPEFLRDDPRGRRIPDFLRLSIPLLQQEQRQLLKESSELSQKVEHVKRIIHTQQEYAGSLDLLEEATVSDLIREAASFCKERFQRHRVELVTRLSVDPPLFLPKTKLVQVLVNLLNNALESIVTFNGEVRRVTVTSSESGDRLQLVVHDTGVGIPAGELTRIFQHGVSSKPGGHGFGLHSCATLLQSMGGAITAESDGPGLGARFYLQWPWNKSADAAPLRRAEISESQPKPAWTLGSIV